jgi:hypothetical protein
VLPRYEVREVHSIRVAAPPAEVFRALKELTLREAPVFRLLLGLRALPARLARPLRRAATPAPLRPPSDTRLLHRGLDLSYTTLAEIPGAELLVGGVGQPWLPTGGTAARITGPEEFVAFDQPGFAKIALDFSLRPVPDGTLLTTETRVDTTDPLSHRRFGAYWRVIRMWSGVTRRSWLRAVRRRAQRARTRPA